MTAGREKKKQKTSEDEHPLSSTKEEEDNAEEKKDDGVPVVTPSPDRVVPSAEKNDFETTTTRSLQQNDPSEMTVEEDQDLSLIDVSEGAIEEERKLAKEREEENRDQTKEITSPEAVVLDDKKFEHLDELLNKTNMYTEFLKEQMEEGQEDDDDDDDDDVDLTTTKSNKKRKSTGTEGKKKEKKTDAEKTQELLPLMESSAVLRGYQLRGVKWLI